ncbi:response regulator [Desulfofundulus sp. TPOSR]|uniref:Stage 0 sporulation protein A homolog n=1 Tax=Desulfofundulus kuznetsovii (strain DSM 6115 / VKM B-1805 / 17) TaxID=760568 RepID=A0AAU8PE10_DESK7|nr:HD domain-containing phosphohydrolase [Desulfofundulus sp. TPOSR]AEG15590.1 response regulator receiver modulated metal dependent phosphohydrolase [Desulfofundulus kuznetsovii DSM 6115]NHM27747.1 response regulator [Desulfofundulus sp. TPOSR]
MEEQKAKILVVDDNPVNLALLEALLAPRGYQVILSTDGPDALRQVARQSPDLVLLDVMMPRMDGFAVCRELKKDEATRFIPVILVTALDQLTDRIRGIEAGADDFLTKPINEQELTARVRSLLRVKKLNDRLLDAHGHINALADQTARLLKTFNPLEFNLEAGLRELLQQTLLKSEEKRPEAVLLGIRDNDGHFTGWLYSAGGEGQNVKAERLALDLTGFEKAYSHNQDILYANWPESTAGCRELQELFAPLLCRRLGTIRNFVGYYGESLVVMAFNYPQPVGGYEADVFRSLMTYTHFLKVVSDQSREVQEAFLYTIDALARAAEANDEDTGNHILRVGAYARLLARELGCSPSFTKAIEHAARMHDVGKIHIHPDILRKPGPLSPEEWTVMKQHTIYGARILGDSPHLALAREIALHHHEKWDGSGYPGGLRGEDISLGGRIVALADVYDALRNRRSYKPAYSHLEAYSIITRGDGRVMPGHFDPEVLGAFQKIAPAFAETYDKLRD